MPNGISAVADSWSQWRHHMPGFEIYKIYENTNLSWSKSRAGKPPFLFGSDWHGKCKQSWVRGQSQQLSDWLSFLLHYAVASPRLWMWLSLRLTHYLCSEVPSILSFRFTCSEFTFTCFISAWFPLTLSLENSLIFLPFHLNVPVSLRGAEGYKSQEGVIKRNGLKYVILRHFHEANSSGQAQSLDTRDLNTNISNYWDCFQNLHQHRFIQTNRYSAISFHICPPIQSTIKPYIYIYCICIYIAYVCICITYYI